MLYMTVSITELNCKYRMYLFRKGIIKEPFRMDGISRDAVKTFHILDILYCIVLCKWVRSGLSLDHMSKHGEHNGTKDFFPLSVTADDLDKSLSLILCTLNCGFIAYTIKHWVLFMSIAVTTLCGSIRCVWVCAAIFDGQLQPQHLDSHFHPHIYTFYSHIRSWQAPAVPRSHINATRHRYKKLLNVLQKGEGEEKYPNKDCTIVVRYVLQAMYPWMGFSYVCLNSSNPDTDHEVMVKDWKLHRSSV